MKIGETTWAIADKHGEIAFDITSRYYIGGYRTKKATLAECKMLDQKHLAKGRFRPVLVRLVPVTLQPAGDAELLERAVKVLEEVRNDAGPLGNRLRVSTVGMVDEILAAARREVE